MKPVEIVRNIDPKKWQQLADRLNEWAGKNVMVGIPAAENARNDGPIGSAGILAVHEFGSPERGIPERSVVRRSIHDNQAKYVVLNKQSLRKVLRGEMTIEAAINLLGTIAAGDVKLTIRHADLAPLKKATEKRKGSSQPLIDSAQMIQSITHEVRDA